MARKPRTADQRGGLDCDTIVAIATAPGIGAIGVVRISGPDAERIGRCLSDQSLRERRASLAAFNDASGQQIDQGLVLFFRQPRSFTGEDVVEFQGHGGPVVLDLLVQAAVTLGARLARPGEFTERAYLNGKLDLAQAEAVADLIESGSAAAARSAVRSLTGQFSARVETLAADILELRIFVEGAIDFPEDDVDFIGDGNASGRLERLIGRVNTILASATQGALLNEGITIVLAGRPNVGKSSLLNRLLGYERAIVSNTPGTTRDVLTERMDLGGIPLRIVDTAGLRESVDEIEREGVRRALAQISSADRVIVVREDGDWEPAQVLIQEQRLPTDRLTVVNNKIDISGTPPGAVRQHGRDEWRVSALTGAGIDGLVDHLKAAVGYRKDAGVFSARRRHLDALTRVAMVLQRGAAALTESGAGELLADDLRVAHAILGEIVGTVSSDALLGEIFSRFCIGK